MAVYMILTTEQVIYLKLSCTVLINYFLTVGTNLNSLYFHK